MGNFPEDINYHVPIMSERKVCYRQTDKYNKKEHFHWWNVLDDRAYVWSFWSWFDVNRSIFDEDVRRTIFTFS